MDPLQDLLQGKWGSFRSRWPPNLLRIFLSSTPDMAGEREALMEMAYPEVQVFCQKHGLMFEVIDLRWGIFDHMGTRHMSTQLFLEEIKRCQKLSVSSSFIALLGNDYSRCPIPLTIGELEFEAIRAQLLEEPKTLQLLAQRYLKDENAIPPMYVLQQTSQANPDGVEEDLLLILRRAACQAEKHGLISREQLQNYHKSEIYQEIEAGLFRSGECDGQSTMVFFTEVDMPTSDRVDSLVGTDEVGGELHPKEPQQLADLKANIVSMYPELIKFHRIPHEVKPNSFRQKPWPKYLKDFCDQFIAATNHHVLRSLRSQEQNLGKPPELIQELTHHIVLGQKHSQAFCWQQNLLDHICQRIKQNHHQAHSPLVICGPSGCGKTALLCHLSESIHITLGQETVVILRLLGTSQDSSTCNSLLHSLCLQVCLAMGFPYTKPVGNPVLFFHFLLSLASCQGTWSLVLLLDSMEQLHITRNAHRAFWLPKICPPKTHVILTVLQKENEVLQKMTGAPEDYFEMGPLSQEQVRVILSKTLASAGRTLRRTQQELFLQSFAKGAYALPVDLAIRQAQHWTSYIVLAAPSISSSALESAYHLCDHLEVVHGSILIAHVLGYLACARHGLSEAEQKDILSLDNEVLTEIYRLHPPPSKVTLRFPPLLWAQLYQDLAQWLEDRWADGFVLKHFLHRELADAVEQRYLSKPEERIKRHQLLADYFRGTWSWGMKKPIQLPSSSKPVSFDRKVIPQPLWFSSTLANQRKLSELPFHLLQAGLFEELQRDILGNMNWIICRVISPGIESLTADFAMCLAQINCPELHLLQETLLLLQPFVDSTQIHGEVSMIYTEMLSRLFFLRPSYPKIIGNVCEQCESWFGVWPHPVLIPRSGFFHPPGGPLCKTLPGFPKGISILEFNLDQKLLLGGSLAGSMIIWDMEDFTVRHVLTGHSAEVKCVKLFGKGSRAASVAMDRTLRLWCLDSASEEFSIHNVHPGELRCCQLHIDEKNQMIYWASGLEVSAWHLETAVPIFQISAEPPDQWLCGTVFVPRLVVVTVSERGVFCLWDSISGQLHSKQELIGLEEEIPTCSVLLHTLGRMVAGFSKGSLLMISSDGHSLLEKLPGRISFVVLSKDESLLATGVGHCVRVFLGNVTGFHQLLPSDLLHSAEVCAAAISTDNSIIVTSSQDECIWVWCLAKQGLLTDVLTDTGMPSTHLALWDVTLVSASCHTSYLRIWDLSCDRKHKLLPPCMASKRCIGLSHNAKYIYFPQAYCSSNVVIWDTEAGKEHDKLDASAPVQCLEVAEQKNLLFVGLVSGTVLVFPLDSRQDVGCIPPAENQKPICNLALTQNEDQLAVACDDLVQVLDLHQEEQGLLIDRPAYTFYTQIPGATISSVALLSGYRVLYGMTNGELFTYYCLEAHVFPLEAHGNCITCLKTSHGEKWLLSGSEDSLLCLWDVQLCSWEHQMFFQKIPFPMALSVHAFQRMTSTCSPALWISVLQCGMSHGVAECLKTHQDYMCTKLFHNHWIFSPNECRLLIKENDGVQEPLTNENVAEHKMGLKCICICK
ncbi:NACHT domain- and WD repeat-containing protein 1 isoform X3 [Crotalus tigris]|uniref:NACHT domain- and WD repeat-containing protein 1 isoform X3 n=1 Tax=Crotalus tigris TaxID=88082 RepID=UPI00192F2021|nr:NACHT domain- and WD repeat-containing protein 1 isoform X3 [Crotalus tigris]